MSEVCVLWNVASLSPSQRRTRMTLLTLPNMEKTEERKRIMWLQISKCRLSKDPES